MGMLEIGNDEIQVMNRLIHAEKVEHLIEEISLSQHVIIDIIKQLFHHRYIKAVDAHNSQKLSINVDQIRQTSFQLTAKGFNELERFSPEEKTK
jgi:hypothetical protein